METVLKEEEVNEVIVLSNVFKENEKEVEQDDISNISLKSLKEEHPNITCIRNIKVGCEGTVLVRASHTLEIAKNKKQFVKLIISDDLDTRVINIFEDSLLFKDIQIVPQNSFIIANIRFDNQNETYKNYSLLSLIVKRIDDNKHKINANMDKIRFGVAEYIISLRNNSLGLHKLVNEVYRDSRVLPKIFTAPLSQNSAYDYIGGYATHILKMCHLTDNICNVYNTLDITKDNTDIRLNRDFMITGVLLHEVGALMSYNIDANGNIEKTYYSYLNESAGLTNRIVLKYIEGSELNEKQKELLIHLISSVKGKLEYGALTVPRTKEAVLLSEIEAIEHSVGLFESISRDALTNFPRPFDKTYCLDKF